MGVVRVLFSLLAYQYYVDPAHIPAEGILVCDFAAEKGSIMEILGCSQNMWDENGNLVYGFYYSKLPRG